MRTGLLALLSCAAVLVAPLPALAQTSPPTPVTLPDVTPVALDPSTTALLVLDINSAVCPPNPACIASLPTVARLMARARSAGVLVGLTTFGGSQILPEVAPRDGEPVVNTFADKFFQTNLDQVLKERGIQTLVLVGIAANGAVLYTSYGANERGYTVAVATDGISSPLDFDTYLGEYQVLSQPGFPNLTNDPLKARAATLTRSDLITFAPANK